VALVCLGDVGALNACKYAGLALVLIGFAPRRGRLLWALTALAWMPALGWLASRFGIDPVTTAIGRNIIALAGAAWAWWAGVGKVPSRELDYVGRLETTP
jgi:hypothetical protein